MYLAAYLDRGNLGNAKNQGLVKDLIGAGMALHLSLKSLSEPHYVYGFHR
jgi:hypothetical protein